MYYLHTFEVKKSVHGLLLGWGGKGNKGGIGIMLPAWAKLGGKGVIWGRQVIKYT